MEIVLEVIAEHLQTNRRLVVPNFGAFVVKESGERLFSDLLRTDDGVLTSLLRNKGLTEMETAVVTDRFIFEVRHELEQYGYCRLGEVGTLRVEPTTKVIKLYPPVYGEMPKQTPYIPKIDERRETKDESKSVGSEKETPNAPNAPNASNAPIAPKKPRKKVDLVMVVAVIILLVALLGIGYGWYVSNLGVADDDAAMDALRVVPEQVKE